MQQKLKRLIEQYEKRIHLCKNDDLLIYDEGTHARTSAEQEIKTLTRVVRQLRKILNCSE